MEKNRNEFLELVCTLYILALLVGVPLYTGGTYWKIGDAKYLLYRNVAVVCLGIWLCLTLATLTVQMVKPGRKTFSWSTMDTCVLAYGGCVLISALCSAYKQTAWIGYQDWYMGAVSQLMFVGAYFLVSRYYVAKRLTVYLGEGAFAAVIVIGLLNRLGFDPIKMYTDFQTTDWEYSHMFSTIGNINWFCGYCSVMLAFPIAGYVYSQNKEKQIILYICSVLGLTLLCIQGSSVGPVIAMAGIGICILKGIKNPQCFQRGLLLALGLCLLFPAMGRLISVRNAQAFTPVDGDIYAKMLWNIWWLTAFLIGVIYLLYTRLGGVARKYMVKTLVVLGISSVGVFVFYELWKLPGADAVAWGNGRGGLWSAALTGFAGGDWKQKIFGAGPDCFAEYIYAMPEARAWIQMEGHWANSVFSNAHNEWLNQLVNIGLLGVAAYLSIFLCGLKRYRGMLLAVLALGMYGVNSLVGFQQVLNAPLLFVILGICENRYRKQNGVNHLTDE